MRLRIGNECWVTTTDAAEAGSGREMAERIVASFPIGIRGETIKMYGLFTYIKLLYYKVKRSCLQIRFILKILVLKSRDFALLSCFG